MAEIAESGRQKAYRTNHILHTTLTMSTSPVHQTFVAGFGLAHATLTKLWPAECAHHLDDAHSAWTQAAADEVDNIVAMLPEDLRGTSSVAGFPAQLRDGYTVATYAWCWWKDEKEKEQKVEENVFKYTNESTGCSLRDNVFSRALCCDRSDWSQKATPGDSSPEADKVKKQPCVKDTWPDVQCPRHREALKMVKMEQEHSTGALLPFVKVLNLMNLTMQDHVTDFSSGEPKAVAAFYVALEHYLLGVLEAANNIQVRRGVGFLTCAAIDEVLRTR